MKRIQRYERCTEFKAFYEFDINVTKCNQVKDRKFDIIMTTSSKDIPIRFFKLLRKKISHEKQNKKLLILCLGIFIALVSLTFCGMIM